jgi:hypothetical protein
MPKTPWAENVFKSACIPAPPLQSDPATLKTFFTADPLLSRQKTQKISTKNKKSAASSWEEPRFAFVQTVSYAGITRIRFKGRRAVKPFLSAKRSPNC